MTLQGFPHERSSFPEKMDDIFKTMNTGLFPMPKIELSQNDITQKLIQHAASMLANIPSYQPMSNQPMSNQPVPQTQTQPRAFPTDRQSDNKSDLIKSLIEASIRDTINKNFNETNKSIRLNGELKITSNSTTTIVKFNDNPNGQETESPMKSSASKRKSSIPTRLPVMDKPVIPVLFNTPVDVPPVHTSDSGVLDLSNTTSVSESNQTPNKDDLNMNPNNNLLNLPLLNYLQKQLSHNPFSLGQSQNTTPAFMPTLLPKPQNNFSMSAPNSPMKTLKRVSSGPRGPRTHTTRKTNGSSRRFPCNQCREEFNSLHSLEEHTLAMHGSYRCHICNAQFTQRSNLQRHALKHVGFKPFECRVCNKAYYRKDHLIRHMEMGHPGYDPRQNITVHLTSSESLEFLNRASIIAGNNSANTVGPNNNGTINPNPFEKNFKTEEADKTQLNNSCEKIDVVNDHISVDECEPISLDEAENMLHVNQRLSNSTTSLSIDMMDTYDSHHMNSFNVSTNSSGNSPIQSPERTSSTSYQHIDLPSPNATTNTP